MRDLLLILKDISKPAGSVRQGIYDKMQEKNASLAQVAELVGVHRATLRQVLNGTRRPDAKLAVNLERIFGTSAEDLMLEWEKEKISAQIKKARLG